MGMDRRPAQSAFSHWRAALLASSALVRLGLAAATVSGGLALVLIATAPPARADGGPGGPSDVAGPGGIDSLTGPGARAATASAAAVPAAAVQGPSAGLEEQAVPTRRPPHQVVPAGVVPVRMVLPEPMARMAVLAAAAAAHMATCERLCRERPRQEVTAALEAAALT